MQTSPDLDIVYRYDSHNLLNNFGDVLAPLLINRCLQEAGKVRLRKHRLITDILDWSPIGMAYVLRKVHNVHARMPTDITTEALRRIGELYAIEADICGSPADERLAARKARNVPLMQLLCDWVKQQMTILSRHSDTAKAFTYMLKQWGALSLYCRNGWAEMDNNIAENALRGVALGRKD